jgi:hypothetical protein
MLNLKSKIYLLNLKNKVHFLDWAWWCKPVMQAIWEAEKRGLWSESGLAKSSKPYLKNKINQK